MNRDVFWRLIEKTATGNCQQQVDLLERELRELSVSEIASFYGHFHNLMSESYQADLWNVARIILGGCSDDWFDYFRGWLIGQGQQPFETVLAKPEAISELLKPGDEPICQSIVSVAGKSYQEKTGTWDVPYVRRPRILEGQLLEEAQLRERYPALWARYMERAD